MHKRILVQKACGSSDEPHECNGICEQAQLYGIGSVCKCDKDNEDLENLYNMEIRRVDPVVACEKIKLATDQRFSCYDREEESISLQNYNEMHYGYTYD